MKKIFNWTFGSVFRTFGRVLAYILIGTIVALLLSKTGVKITSLLPIMRVSAKTFTTTENYRVRRCLANCACDCTFTSWTSNGTNTSINTSNYVSDGLSMNLGTSEVFYSGTSYRVYTSYDYSGSMNFAKNPYNFNCFGGTTNSTSGGEDSNIQSCTLVGVALKDNNITYVFDVVPLVDIKAIKINIYFSAESWTSIKGNTSKSSVVIDTSASDAINNQTDSLINNQNQNTQDIIDNNSQNTQDIINNQNELLGTECTNLIDKTKFEVGHYNGSSSNTRVYLHQNIYLQSGTYYFKTNLGSEKNYNLVVAVSQFPSNSTKIYESGWKTNSSLSFNINQSGYFTVMLRFNDDSTVNLNDFLNYNYMLSKEDKPYCEYGTYLSKLDETTNSINNLNDNLNNDDTSEATSEINDFFSNFSTNNHGLTGIISAPLNAINSLTSKTCSPLVLPLPFVNQNLTLPCMRTIYVQNFGAFMNIYDVITLGIISYWVMVRIFNLVKDFKNPEHDEIEVMDL